MAHSSLLGIDRILPSAPGHDTASLGPSDSSDSGSDLAGLENLNEGDPGQPVDVSVATDKDHPGTAAETVGSGTDTDAAGTGERRSAGGDAGAREARDLTPDRVVSVDDVSASLDEPNPLLLEELETQDLDPDEVAQAADSETEEEDVQALPESGSASRSKPRKRARR